MADEPIVDNDTELVVEEPVQETQPETVEPSAEDLAEKNKQLFERAKKAEAKAKELETKLKSKDLQPNPDSDQRFERLELKTEGYKSDEVDFLMQNGGRKALDNPIVMAGIEAIRKKEKSESATPTGTGKSTVYQKYTEADLRRMPEAELAKIIPQ